MRQAKELQQEPLKDRSEMAQIEGNSTAAQAIIRITRVEDQQATQDHE